MESVQKLCELSKNCFFFFFPVLPESLCPHQRKREWARERERARAREHVQERESKSERERERGSEESERARERECVRARENKRENAQERERERMRESARERECTRERASVPWWVWSCHSPFLPLLHTIWMLSVHTHMPMWSSGHWGQDLNHGVDTRDRDRTLLWSKWLELTHVEADLSGAVLPNTTHWNKIQNSVPQLL